MLTWILTTTEHPIAAIVVACAAVLTAISTVINARSNMLDSRNRERDDAAAARELRDKLCDIEARMRVLESK